MIREGVKGTPVWVLAHGWWRRGVIVARLRKNIVVDYVCRVSTGEVARRHFDPDGNGVQPDSLDPHENNEPNMPEGFHRPVAKAPRPELKG